jgi:hypothetical protein
VGLLGYIGVGVEARVGFHGVAAAVGAVPLGLVQGSGRGTAQVALAHGVEGEARLELGLHLELSQEGRVVRQGRLVVVVLGVLVLRVLVEVLQVHVLPAVLRAPVLEQRVLC